MPTSGAFRAIWFADAVTGWTGGGAFDVPGGLVGRTRDGGRTWRFASGLAGSSRVQVGADVTALRFFDGQTGVAATSTGRILRTDDGGVGWTDALLMSRDDQPIVDLTFVDDERGWALGTAGVWTTSDRGRTWRQVAGATALVGVVGRAVQFIDDRQGWIVGTDGALRQSEDGGVTWRAVDVAGVVGPPPQGSAAPDLEDVFFVDEAHGWVVGEEGTILATSDGGRTWLRQEPGVADARSAPVLERIPRNGGVDVVDAGNRTPGLTFEAVHFSDTTHGVVIGRYANLGRSIVLRTSDGGGTWVVDAAIAGEELRALFVGHGYLWAVGTHAGPGPPRAYRREAARAAN